MGKSVSVLHIMVGKLCRFVSETNGLICHWFDNGERLLRNSHTHTFETSRVFFFHFNSTVPANTRPRLKATDSNLFTICIIHMNDKTHTILSRCFVGQRWDFSVRRNKLNERQNANRTSGGVRTGKLNAN